ncbi:hypothetical protein JW930_03340 [Candidatus Woesearchaeota archaeon]|nr:hypothetical protein [Candidatus Woesearchaeota archaeon]
MKTNNKELAVFVLVEIVTIFVIGLAFKGIERAIHFAFAYLFVYFLPYLPLWFRFRKRSIVEQFVLINVIGLCISPVVFFLVSFLIAPLSNTLFMALPIVLLFFNLLLNRPEIKLYFGKKADKESKKQDKERKKTKNQ